MRPLRLARVLLLGVLTALFGCDGVTSPDVDAGQEHPHDGAVIVTDSGVHQHDAGASTVDAGGHQHDAGGSTPDAGEHAHDAGNTSADGGHDHDPVDAGSFVPDSGVPHIDSFTGTPQNIKAGTVATLQWVLSGPTPTRLTVNGTSVLGKTSHAVSPTGPSTSYTLIAGNAGGSHTVSVTVLVESTAMPYIDASKIPPAEPGFSTKRVEPTSMTITPGNDPETDVGAFRLGCTFSNMNFDDPLVYPGKPGAAHLHTYFGNTGVNFASTDDSIQNAGNSTCSGGILNRTGYWVPSMIDTTDGTPITPSGMLVYYKTGYGGVKARDVKPVPEGLHMIGGDMKNTTEEGAHASRFACVGGDTGVGWQVGLPTNCFSHNQMILEISFPQCWDGKNLDSIDHKRHMAEPTGTGCPATHPVGLPHIQYEIYYDLAHVDLSHMSKWRLSSDHYPPGTPGGYSAHGDYMYGWDKKTLDTFITLCDQTGSDCHANLLGDGTWLY